MTQYNFSCRRDKIEFEKAFDRLLRTILGTNLSVEIGRQFRKEFEYMVEKVTIYPQGVQNTEISPPVPGKCGPIVDRDDGKIEIIMYGFDGADSSQYDWLEHQFTHELTHAFADILGKIMRPFGQGVSGKVVHQNAYGMIEEIDPRTGELIDWTGRYGKMFNETMMDIVTYIAKNSDTRRKPIDKFLSGDYVQTEETQTSYTFLVTLTQLTMAAFSNVSDADYQNYIVGGGLSAFNVDGVYPNGEKCKLNDFLYGILFDPMHVEKKFNEVQDTISDGSKKMSYKELCNISDGLYAAVTGRIKMSDEDFRAYVKMFMRYLKYFFVAKLKMLENRGMVNQAGLNVMKNRFDNLFNIAQQQYQTFFSAEELSWFADDKVSSFRNANFSGLKNKRPLINKTFENKIIKAYKSFGWGD